MNDVPEPIKPNEAPKNLFSGPPPKLPSVNIPSKAALQFRKQLKEVKVIYMDELDNFLPQVELDEESGCWIWKPSKGWSHFQHRVTSQIYPMVHGLTEGKSRSITVSVWFYAAFKGPVRPDLGRVVCACPKAHRRTTKYRDRPYTCVNPFHHRQHFSPPLDHEKEQKEKIANRSNLGNELAEINRSLNQALEQARAKKRS